MYHHSLFVMAHSLAPSAEKIHAVNNFAATALGAFLFDVNRLSHRSSNNRRWWRAWWHRGGLGTTAVPCDRWSSNWYSRFPCIIDFLQSVHYPIYTNISLSLLISRREELLLFGLQINSNSFFYLYGDSEQLWPRYLVLHGCRIWFARLQNQ